jgi:hypothetical protein
MRYWFLLLLLAFIFVLSQNSCQTNSAKAGELLWFVGGWTILLFLVTGFKTK